eukprot:COSAG02_NODE_9946_length_2068_cov_1.930929_1_plen_39_part_00
MIGNINALIEGLAAEMQRHAELKSDRSDQLEWQGLIIW